MGDVRHPEWLGAGRFELTLYPIQRLVGGLVWYRCDTAPAAPYAMSSQVFHQLLHGTAGRRHGLTTRLLPELASPPNCRLY